MLSSFMLAWRALVRGHMLTLLLAATALAHFFLPALVRSDGTDAGWREMFVRAVPGAAYAFTAIAVLCCACGFFAQERERSRLALTVVRPASAFAVALGRWLALCAVAAAAVALSAIVTVCRVPSPPACMHHHAPSLPPPVEEARRALEQYLADPQTPEAVKKAPRSAVLRLLTNKELDRYDVVSAGNAGEWPFAAGLQAREGMLVRVRFATQFEMRAPLVGEFMLGGFAAAVSNNTQNVLDFPLVPKAKGGDEPPAGALRFANHGKENVMLRPRRDLELLEPADSFAANLLRAALEMFSMCALLAAFGMFLSSALSRPVAIFTAVVAVIVTLMAPSVVAQFPDEMDAKLVDRFGLWVSNLIAFVTSAASSSDPVSDLATDTCIEWRAVARNLLSNLVLLPALLLSLSSVLVRRKPLAENS